MGLYVKLYENSYYCPYCNQKSTRRWNLQTHIKRRHGGTGGPIPKMPNVPMQSSSEPVSNNWHGDFPKSRYPNNIFSTSKDDQPDLQRYIIETLWKIKEINEIRSYFAPGGLNGGLPTNLCFSDWGTPLGFKGYVCKKCISFEIVPIFDDVKRKSLKSRHACNPQKLHDAQFVADIPGTIHKRRRELISCLTFIVN